MVWGPPLFGAMLATGSIMGCVACASVGRWVLFVPCLIGGLVATVASIDDALTSPGQLTRVARLADNPCRMCAAKDARLAAVTRDRDELREAIMTLQLPPDPGKGR